MGPAVRTAYCLAAFEAGDLGPAEMFAAARRRAGASELVEPLSERELEVLQLIAEGLSNREVGARLYLSPNTVKRHAGHIYEKLGVHSRTEAVARARALGILA